MLDKILPMILSTALFGTSAYFLTQSKSCECTDVNPTSYSYILGFSYVAIGCAILVYTIGESFAKLAVKNPVLILAPLLYMVGLAAWALLTIQYSYTLKACKCPSTIAGNVTFSVAVLDLLIMAVVLLTGLFGGYKVLSLSSKDRSLFLSGFKTTMKA
jgi:hypothetical protein